MPQKHLVFVYGTLLQGLCNHRRLEGAEFLGEAETVAHFTMFAHSGFPAVTCAPLYPIKGQVFSVDEEGLAKLDRLEGYVEGRSTNHYQRKLVTVNGADVKCNAWMYYQDANTPYGMEKLKHGDYRFHLLVAEAEKYADSILGADVV